MYFLEAQRRVGAEGAISFDLEMCYSTGRTKYRSLYVLGFTHKELIFRQETERFVNNDIGVVANRDLDRIERFLNEAFIPFLHDISLSDMMQRIVKFIGFREQAHRVLYPGERTCITAVFAIPEMIAGTGKEEPSEKFWFKFPNFKEDENLSEPSNHKDDKNSGSDSDDQIIGLDDLPF